MVRLIAVVLHQRRAATAERAVGPRFHGAHLQAIVEFGHARTRLHDAAAFGLSREHRVDADRQLARRRPARDTGRYCARIDAGVVHAGHAERRELVHRGEQLPLHFRVGGLRNVLLDQRFCRIDQHAGRLAGSIAHDLSAVRVRRRRA